MHFTIFQVNYARVSITATAVNQHCYNIDSVKKKNINNGQVNDEESSSTICFLLLPHFLIPIFLLF